MRIRSMVGTPLGWKNARDPVVLIVVFMLLVLVAAALASHSFNAIFLGKSKILWAIILVAGVGAVGVAIAALRFEKFPWLLKRYVILGITVLALIEGTGFLLPQYWPVPVLQRLPGWARDILPDRAFTRSNFRPLNNVSDPELGYRLPPNTDELIIDRERKFRGFTDSQGLSNIDESLYGNAEVVTVGDSFTQGWGAGYGNSWPQQLAQISGLRVLNLGTAGYHVYQFPQILERYGESAAPSVVVIGLTSWADFQITYYLYEDYRQENPEGKGYREFSRGEARWGGLKSEKKNYLEFLLEVTTYITPFTTSTVSYFMNPDIRPQLPVCEFTLRGNKISMEFTALEQMSGDHRILHLDRVSDDLTRAAEFIESIGAEPYFVYLPYPEEVYIPLLESANDLNECASSLLADQQAGRFNWDNYREQYEEALGARSDLLSDATPFLQQHAAEGEQQNWTFDPHPNPLGYGRIAEFVSEVINK